MVEPLINFFFGIGSPNPFFGIGSVSKPKKKLFGELSDEVKKVFSEKRN